MAYCYLVVVVNWPRTCWSIYIMISISKFPWCLLFHLLSCSFLRFCVFLTFCKESLLGWLLEMKITYASVQISPADFKMQLSHLQFKGRLRMFNCAMGWFDSPWKFPSESYVYVCMWSQLLWIAWRLVESEMWWNSCCAKLISLRMV